LNNIITGCSVNQAGGGIFCNASSNPVIRFNKIIGNSGGIAGGAIRCTGSSPTIDSNIIQNNTASGSGGISCSHISSPVISNNIIQNNQGSAILCHYFSNAKIRNNLITGHTNVPLGTIQIQEDSTVSLISNTITANTAAYAGALYVLGNSNVTLIDNIMWGNSPIDIYMGESPGISSILESELRLDDGSGISNISLAASTLTASYCDIKGGSSAIVTNSGDTVNWGIGNIDKDPMFDGFRLSDFSPCIGKGIMTTGVPTTDIEGKARPTPVATNPDIGAYENDRSQPLEGFITVKKPNGGELLKGGSSYNVT
jgi:hypothetical protein